ncbi:NAD kinase [bioreactor metagenome]|uniref:NAD kinase n=1 Tax=bioreactor metagenome TaxID=1076179 RepID=A0A645BKA8_9ZZZZ
METIQRAVIENIAIAIHPTSNEAMKEGLAVKSFIQQNWGINCIIARVNDPHFQAQVKENKIDLMITLGGDGTMLRAGHLCAPVNVPLLGINMGRFGFLMQVALNEWKDVLQRVFNGEYAIEDRMMLEADVWRGDKLLQSSQVINEVVVCRGQVVRPIRIHAKVDGYSLASYMADGLIAATPTGSTAYALAVGGPIMPPELRNILIVAVAPHLSMDRAVILPEGACVEITTNTDHEAVVSLDGHTPIVLQNDDKVVVKSSHYTVKFLTFKDPGYFYRNLGNYLEQNPSIGGFK